MFFINKIGAVDKNEFSCTAETIAMVPNKDAEEELAALLVSCEKKLVKFTKNIPVKQFTRALYLLMKHDVLRFRTNYYRQKDGVAIGDPPSTD